MITAIDAHYVLAKDLGRAVTFYRDALGLEVAMEFPSGVEFTLPDGSAFGIGIMPNGDWHQGGGAMFAVPDLDAASERVRAGGGSFMSGTFESPSCWTRWCMDTEGNNFALHRLKE